jgi:hypothetical protein
MIRKEPKMTINELYDMTDYLTAVKESLPRSLSTASRRQQLMEVGHFADVAATMKLGLRDPGAAELLANIQQKAVALQDAICRMLGNGFRLSAA